MSKPDQKPQILRIERDCDPVEQSATIMAVMAYPRRGDEEKRMHAFEALVARPLHERRTVMRDDTPIANARLETFLELKTQAESTLLSKKVQRQLNARAEVGDVVQPWIVDLWKGSEPDLPELTDKVLMDRASEMLNRSPENWLRRTWRPSKPVFHLICAYHVAHLVLPPEVQDPFNPLSKPVRAPDTDLTRDVIHVAMDFQEKLVADPRFPFRRDDLIWIESDLEKGCDEPLKSDPD